MKLIPHARAGDDTLRFDYAAPQAVSHPSEPDGAPLHFYMLEIFRYLMDLEKNGKDVPRKAARSELSGFCRGKSRRRQGRPAARHLALGKGVPRLQSERGFKLLVGVHAITV